MAQIDTLFESIENDILSESVKLEMAVLFENAITEAVKAKEEELDAKNLLATEQFQENLTNKINDYLELFVEEFTKENASSIVESVKVKTAERVLKTFSQLVTDFHIQLDEKVETDQTELTEAKAKLNKVTLDLIEAKKEVKMREKAALITEAASKLETELEKAKLLEYGKKLPFDELFEKKINAYAKTVITEAKKPFSKEVKVEKLVITEEKETPPFVEEVDKKSQYKW